MMKDFFWCGERHRYGPSPSGAVKRAWYLQRTISEKCQTAERFDLSPDSTIPHPHVLWCAEAAKIQNSSTRTGGHAEIPQTASTESEGVKPSTDKIVSKIKSSLQSLQNDATHPTSSGSIDKEQAAEVIQKARGLINILETKVMTDNSTAQRTKIDSVSRSMTETTESVIDPTTISSEPSGSAASSWRPTLPPRPMEPAQADRPITPGRSRPIWSSDVINTIEVFAERWFQENMPTDQ